MRLLPIFALPLSLALMGCPENDDTCIDVDGDGYGVHCSSGLDCDDDDPNSFANCASCVDADADLAFTGCDVYATVAGPDCDDGDPESSPLLPEVADDGIDNDCSAGDLVALTALASESIFVDEANPSCSDVTRSGSRGVPFCTLPAALAAASGVSVDVFVAEGDYTAPNWASTSGGYLGLHGGYDSSWDRDVATNTTSVDFSDLGSLECRRDVCMIDGFEFDRSTPVTGGGFITIGGRQFSAVTRSTFVSEENPAGLLFVSGDMTPGSRAIVREVNVEAEGGFPLAFGGYGTGWLEQSKIRAEGTGAVYASTLDNDVNYLFHNAITAESSSRANGFLSDAGEIFAINNSFYMNGTTSSVVFRLRVANREIRLVNNTLLSATPSAYLADLASDDVDVTLVHNLVGVADGDLTSDAGFLTGDLGTLSSAAEANACSFCDAAFGNFFDDPEFVAPTLGNLWVPENAPGVDAGIDPDPYSDYDVPDIDFYGRTRPYDGDGDGGDEWDLGAHEWVED